MARKPLRIAITTGDTDGIGTEVAAKALAKLKPQRNTIFYLWRSPRCPKKHLNLIDSSFRRITVATWPEALSVTPSTHKELVDINSNLPPPKWVDLAAHASLFGHIDGIATGPLSKTLIKQSGYNCLGHTEMLKKITKADDLFMAFIGREFNVLLATGHIPLSAVTKQLSENLIVKALRAAHAVASLLPARAAKKPLALIGLNPHSGEQGLIGKEESTFFAEALSRIRKAKISVEGPLVPDAAFFSENWKKYSVFISPYHDQGLIPFKLVHGQESGVHITIGLPFVRTSVDHGCAKNLFGKNKANASSMQEAIEWAIKLCKREDLK